MPDKTYNFQNPEIQQRATQKARTSTRPRTYRSKSKILQEAKKELVKEELLKQGFLQQVGAILPQVNDALITGAYTKVTIVWGSL